MASVEDRTARVQAIIEALSAGHDGLQGAGAAPGDDERVRIATVLLRYGRSVADSGVMVDALLAAAGQTVAEHGLDPAAAQGDFAAFLAAARQDVADRRAAATHRDPDERAAGGDAAERLN
jgi:hypothetical protein